MKKHNYLFFLFFLTYFFYGQSKYVKEEVFKQIEVFARSKNIFSKELKELKLNFNSFENNSVFIPITRYNYILNKFDDNSNIFFISYENISFIYKGKKLNILYDNFFANFVISNHNINKDVFLTYLLNDDNFNKDLFITNNKKDFIFIQKDINTLDEYVIMKYKSLDKFLELEKTIIAQKHLNSKDIIKSITSNYHLYENKCPCDTLLVVNSFISQVKNAVLNFTVEQQNDLREKILTKLRSTSLNNIYSRQPLVSDRLYSISIYKVDIEDELLSVITKKDYVDYLNYIDIYYPIVSGKKSRKIFGFEILSNEFIIDKKDNNSFSKYINDIILKEGCGERK